ncbi:protein FAR1-RELATED SEQUENCE 2-like [Silene latifolia]|uniref:protein FAR1-RELATED SEQUENCE 2-like n=1 Tax=Silene latifolia TaxID=37657 RepID=UPI003D785CA8
MVFVPFTGVDHHKRCITFGAALLGDESIECYTWLFKTFLEAMGGCQPRIIITDQDKSMKSVVPEVFKESTHRLCVWNNQLEPDEFEEQWGKIMTDYQLVEHEWFSDLYNLREQWIPAYFKDVSMSGLMRVTSRSESENKNGLVVQALPLDSTQPRFSENTRTVHNAKMDKSGNE